MPIYTTVQVFNPDKFGSVLIVGVLNSGVIYIEQQHRSVLNTEVLGNSR